MELSALLLPLVVSLLLFLLEVVVSNGANLLNCLFAIAFRVLRDLD